MSGLIGGLELPTPTPLTPRDGVRPYLLGEASREVPVERGMPDRFRAVVRPTCAVENYI